MDKKGFTLVEILVAMFLTGLVMAGLVGLWVSSTNFASAGKQELLFKNMFSIAEKTIHKDISEASVVAVSSFKCLNSVGFLKFYKNYYFSKDADGNTVGACMVQSATINGYSVVEYCFANNAIFRSERVFACGAPPPLGCGCTLSSPMVMKGLAGAPAASVSGSMVNVVFSASTTLGKESRPLNMNFSKSFAFSGQDGSMYLVGTLPAEQLDVTE